MIFRRDCEILHEIVRTLRKCSYNTRVFLLLSPHLLEKENFFFRPKILREFPTFLLIQLTSINFISSSLRRTFPLYYSFENNKFRVKNGAPILPFLDYCNLSKYLEAKDFSLRHRKLWALCSKPHVLRFLLALFTDKECQIFKKLNLKAEDLDATLRREGHLLLRQIYYRRRKFYDRLTKMIDDNHR